MRIDGKAIAEEICRELKLRVNTLQKNHITPHLAIILVDDDPASVSYVRRKELKAKEIGAKITLIRYPKTVTTDKLLSCLNDLNHLSTVHGIIVQRPLPSQIDSKEIDLAVSPEKDIDGFHKNTKFKMPLAEAVIYILKRIHVLIHQNKNPQVESRGLKLVNLRGWQSGGWQSDEAFTSWLKKKNIVVIGKGQTGGGPTISLLIKLGIEPTVIDSKTENPKRLTKQADIVISAIGKPSVIKPNDLKKGVILIGVGMYKGTDGKMHGDYEEAGIKNIASFYTPIPGGVGPVNVAMLLSNLVAAAEHKRNSVV